MEAHPKLDHMRREMYYIVLRALCYCANRKVIFSIYIYMHLSHRWLACSFVFPFMRNAVRNR